jgi:serine/threonine protein kinase
MGVSNESKCPQCGALLKDDAPAGLCPHCLMALNLKTETIFTDDPPATQPPLPPEQIAPHFPQLEILEFLGRGGMGVVYKARQKALNRLVALKLLAPERVNDTKFAERFTREAQALAALNHPNIVTIYDFGQAGGFYYLLMEFVDGVNLRQLLRARKFTPEEALVIVPPLCDALQFAHDRGIVHRDIKPENLLLDKAGRVKVADFGIAKMLGTVNGGKSSEPVVPENSTQTSLGTPGYSAPEQKTDPSRVDSRADIYSLGVVFYEMLTGELPGKPLEPPSTKVKIDVRLDEIVLRALEKKPELRYQQASALKTKVETISADPKKLEIEQAQAASPVQKSDHFWRWFAVAVFAFISIPILISIVGLLAAIAIPNFVKARQQAQENARHAAQDLAGQKFSFEDTTNFYIGQTRFPEGDAIEITSLQRNEIQMVVKGHYHLVSRDNAQLALNITSTNKPNAANTADDARQHIQISKGDGDFDLTHFHLFPGLPHVSMYADGHVFASLYFGTKAEAQAESEAKWIANPSSASAETWSPTLAPGVKPDLQNILNEAKNLMDEGKYEEALQRQIWYFNHALEYDPAQTGVRLSFALAQWVELGRRYPRGKQALLEIRDRDARQLIAGKGFANLFSDVNSINNYLGQEDATLALFKTIYQTDNRLAKECYFYAENLLIQHGEYELLLNCIGDPQTRFDVYQRGFEGQIELQQRMAKRRDQSAVPAARFTNSFTPPDFGKLATNNFVEQVCKLVEILVATDHQTDAEKIRDQALTILDDPRLKSAVSDAEGKISNRKAVKILAEQPPVVVETFPVSNARDIESGETEIRVRFSKEMADGSWSWSSAWENSTPELIGRPHYESDLQTCVVKAKLEPGRTYAFWLNSDQFHNFKDREGRPAVPYLLIFQTKQK